MCWSYLCNAGAGEGHDDGDHVDGELELQKLGNAVVDVPSPHDRLHDAGEVVVRQDDVRRLLGHVRTGDALVAGGEKFNRATATTKCLPATPLAFFDDIGKYPKWDSMFFCGDVEQIPFKTTVKYNFGGEGPTKMNLTSTSTFRGVRFATIPAMFFNKVGK